MFLEPFEMELVTCMKSKRDGQACKLPGQVQVSEFRALVEGLTLNGVGDNAPSLCTGDNEMGVDADPFLLQNINMHLSNDFCYLLEGGKLTWV